MTTSRPRTVVQPDGRIIVLPGDTQRRTEYKLSAGGKAVLALTGVVAIVGITYAASKNLELNFQSLGTGSPEGRAFIVLCLLTGRCHF